MEYSYLSVFHSCCFGSLSSDSSLFVSSYLQDFQKRVSDLTYASCYQCWKTSRFNICRSRQFEFSQLSLLSEAS